MCKKKFVQMFIFDSRDYLLSTNFLNYNFQHPLSPLRLVYIPLCIYSIRWHYVKTVAKSVVVIAFLLFFSQFLRILKYQFSSQPGRHSEIVITIPSSTARSTSCIVDVGKKTADIHKFMFHEVTGLSKRPLVERPVFNNEQMLTIKHFMDLYV